MLKIFLFFFLKNEIPYKFVNDGNIRTKEGIAPVNRFCWRSLFFLKSYYYKIHLKRNYNFSKEWRVENWDGIAPDSSLPERSLFWLIDFFKKKSKYEMISNLIYSWVKPPKFPSWDGSVP